MKLREGETIQFKAWEPGSQHAKVQAIHTWPTGWQILVMDSELFMQLGGELPKGYTAGRKTRRKPPVRA